MASTKGSLEIDSRQSSSYSKRLTEFQQDGETEPASLLSTSRFSVDSAGNAEVDDTYRLEDEDPLSPSAISPFADDYIYQSQHESLLSRIEAPAVTLAGVEPVPDGALPGDPPKEKNGMRMAFMNMANSIIGAGIIGQPYALMQCGLVAGITLLVGLTFVIDWTIRLMVVNAKLSGTNSYQATVSACFGRGGYLAISLAQGLFAFGGSIAFTVIIGDTIPHVISALFPAVADIPVLNLFTMRSPVMIFCVLFISFPLSLSKNIANLAKASLLALISMFVIIVAVVTEGIRAPQDIRGQFSTKLMTVNFGVFQGIGVISFAFVCHHNSLLIYGALRKPTMDRFARVTHWSTGVSMIACLTLALAGFLTFGDKTEGNVLNSFDSRNVLINIARFCFGFNMLTTFPLEIFVCREVLLDYIYSTFFPPAESEVDDFFYPREPSLRAHRFTTAILTLLTLFVALIVGNLGVVLEVVGSTSACMLAYILPPLCYLKLASSEESRTWKSRIGPIACVVFGITVMIVSTGLSIAKAFE
ncbi:transmembrane amino acid transporter protein-domain-containing protein [Kockiozyma suomiensis]|uniref:transmembrane amino acid transporter protein-domain-containing protein n=1 Tax=Kockiozyma suomiensis TaxID=1337062 RepID=UPI0033437B8A